MTYPLLRAAHSRAARRVSLLRQSRNHVSAAEPIAVGDADEILLGKLPCHTPQAWHGHRTLPAMVGIDCIVAFGASNLKWEALQ